MKAARAFAPAKINLFLHVGATGEDGYHPLTSWMVFADVGDSLSLAPSFAMDLRLTGPFAGSLSSDDDNSVVRARDRVLRAAGGEVPPFTLTLDKQLPVASGMGGGSSDAAAALRLVGEAAQVGEAQLREIAAGLGSDVPACLVARSLMARGRGEVLSASPTIPPLCAVLVNPGVAVSTRQIFEAFDAGPPGDLSGDDPPSSFASAQELAAYLARQRNDLAVAAIAAQPAIAEVLMALADAPQTLLARMSGSGATVFALCADDEDAAQLAADISCDHTGWWVRACRLS